MPKGKKIQSEETKQSSEPDTDMTQLLEVSENEFRIIMITMLKALMKKVDNMQDQIGNFSRDRNYKKDSNGWKSETQ